jgi:hypothetical protein
MAGILSGCQRSDSNGTGAVIFGRSTFPSIRKPFGRLVQWEGRSFKKMPIEFASQDQLIPLVTEG